MISIEAIVESLINGQRKQMVNQIDSYGLYEFWDDLKEHLDIMYNKERAYELFADATISYFRIKNR